MRRLRARCGAYEDFTLPVVQGYVVHDVGEWQAAPVTCLACVTFTVTVRGDGLCTCEGFEPCPLGRTGSMLRCSVQELHEAGVATRTTPW